MATRWLDHETWGCDVHVPMAKMPVDVEKCWYCQQEWKGHRPAGDPPAPKPPPEPEPPRGPWGEAMKAAYVVASPKALMKLADESANLNKDAYGKIVLAPTPALRRLMAKPETRYTGTPRGKPDETAMILRGACAWRGCKQAAGEKSKYCSRQCSNRNARARAKARGTG